MIKPLLLDVTSQKRKNKSLKEAVKICLVLPSHMVTSQGFSVCKTQSAVG